MTDNRAVLNPDRLPWLTDEPKSNRMSAWATMLLCAVLIAVLLVGISYWPSMKDVRAADDPTKFAPKSPDATNVGPRERTAELSRNAQVQPPPVPSVLLAAEPTVAAGRHTTTAEIARGPEADRHSGSDPNATSGEPTARQSKSGGFDCRFAKTQGAMAVCSNSILATLDREHTLLYSQSWREANAAKRALLMRARQRFDSHHNACRTDACTSGIYLAAMRELSGIMTAKVPASGGVQSKPSFSCRFAKTRGEVAVCSDANLAALDRHQALLYSQSWGQADVAKRARLLRVHERLVNRRDACGTDSCTSDVYLAAMREVRDIMTRH